MTEENDDAFLGFDFSTQQLKGVIVNRNREVLYESFVQFDSDLPEFRTHNGVVKGEKKTVTAPVLMWVKALDMILDRLRLCGADFSKVSALSGSAQQHGTVYWASGAETALKSLADDSFLHTQLASSFSVTSSPIWMDASTTKQCHMLEVAAGGSQELARITGSRAYERFSASQIAKIAETKPTVYKNTERISLISSFACSLFLGKYANIDFADGSGMNLLDITTKQWSTKLLESAAPDLAEKLGVPVPSHTILGKISQYFVERFGFNEQCDVVPFTGDNPSSLAGMCLVEGDMAFSLGTSDTVFMWLREPKLMTEGHLFINPLSEMEFMGLLCYKNGSLSRERIKQMCADGSWETFNKLLESTPRGNFGYIGFYYDLEEINLPVQGDFRYDKAGNAIDKFPSPETEIRALIEGQFLSKKAQLEDLELPIESFSRIIATGGASQNKAILQVISDVFNIPVYTLDSANSAVLGAAYRAIDSLDRSKDSSQAYQPFQQTLTLACSPYGDSHEIYDPMVVRCRALVSKILDAAAAAAT